MSIQYQTAVAFLTSHGKHTLCSTAFADIYIYTALVQVYVLFPPIVAELTYCQLHSSLFGVEGQGQKTTPYLFRDGGMGDFDDDVRAALGAF